MLVARVWKVSSIVHRNSLQRCMKSIVCSSIFDVYLHLHLDLHPTDIHQYIEEQGLICKAKTIVVSRPEQSKEVAQLDAAVLAATATATSSTAAATAAGGGGGTGTDGDIDIEAGGEKVLDITAEDTTSEENGKKEDSTSTDTNEPWWKSKRCMIGSIAGILLLLIIVVVAVVVSSKGNGGGGGGVSSGEKATPASVSLYPDWNMQAN